MLTARAAGFRISCLFPLRPLSMSMKDLQNAHHRQNVKQIHRSDESHITIQSDGGLTKARSRRDIKTAASAAEGASPSAPANLGHVLKAVGFACLGAFAFGYHLGVINGPLEAIARDLAFAGNKALEGLVVSSVLAGATVGSLGGAGIADKLGRKRGLTLCALPMLLGPLLSAGASGLNMMVLGRFVTGVAIGLSSALVPTYISELAPTTLRGTLGSLNQLMICAGILAALLVNVLLPVASWRAMFALAALPALGLGLGMLGCAESPAWLVRQGRRAEAAQVAQKLWGEAGASQMEPSGAGLDGKPGAGEAAAAASRGASRAFSIGILLFLFQQFSGINALVYFSTSVFRQAGITSDTLASAAVGATNVLGTVIATSIIEKAGRKQLLLSSYLGMGVAMLVMAAGFGLPALQGSSGTIAVLGTLAYILSFAIGAGPVTGLIVPELNPAESRGRAVSAAFVSHWVCNMLVGQTFLAAVSAYGLASVYAGFGAVSLAGLLYISRAVPETRSKSFEQIQAELSS